MTKFQNMIATIVLGVSALGIITACAIANSRTASASVPIAQLSAVQALVDFNLYRAQHGLAPVTLNARLMAVAEKHSKDMAKRGEISHRGRDGSRLLDRLERENYFSSIAAENVSSGQRNHKEALQAWADSPAHNRALLKEDVTEVGIGLTYAPRTKYRTYWTLVLATQI